MHGSGLLIRRVGAGARLRKRKCAERLASRQRSEPSVLLRSTARVIDELGDERIGHGQRGRECRARLRDGLDRQRVADIIAPSSSPGPRNGDAEQPRVGSGANQVARKLA